MTDPNEYWQTPSGGQPPYQPPPPTGTQPPAWHLQPEDSSNPGWQAPPQAPPTGEWTQQYEPIQGPNQPYYGPPMQGPPSSGYPPVPPPKKSRRGAIIAAAAVVVVAAGGATTYVALSDKGKDAGAASPTSAVTALVKDFDKADLLGVLDHLPPGERSSLTDPINDEISQLKRTKVLSSSADPNNITGLSVSTKNLTFDKSTEKINDNVSIVKVTGGTVSANIDLSKIPYTKEFLQTVFKGRATPSGSRSEQFNIGQLVKSSGQPIRIATQKVNGKWYPSLMYSIADNIVHSNGGSNPTPADAVPAEGASSAQDAVKQLVGAFGNQDMAGVIKLLSPDEDAAVHTYGGLIVNASKDGGEDSTDKFTVTSASFNTSGVSGGTLVSLKSGTIKMESGETYSVSINGDCLSASSSEGNTKICASDAVDKVANMLNLNADQRAAMTRVLTALPKLGVVTTETDGKWYVNPVRTYGELTVSVLKNLEPNDLLTLLPLLNN